MKPRFLHEDFQIKPLALAAFTVGAALAVTVVLSWPERAPPAAETPAVAARDASVPGVPVLAMRPRLDDGVDWSKVETATDPGPQEMPSSDDSPQETAATEPWPEETATPEPWPDGAPRSKP